ncbi:MAG: hypothetical protein JWL65_3325 [Gammaproteobacteria bacterium]|nr:hypothetical protein [Gammaproteobacteria bacterium]
MFDLLQTGVANADPIHDPNVAGEIREVLRHAPSVFKIPRAQNLLSEHQAIEARFATQLEFDVEAAISAYRQLAGSANGRILNTDLARELAPEYRADRTLSAAVHEPASALVKQMYARKLAETPGPGEAPVVLFTAGGTGAGKTTGLTLAGIGETGELPQIIYDTNLNALSSAALKIEQALAAGRDVRVVYTYRNPIEALTQGALPRAMRMGRTAPVDEHARTHAGAGEVIQKLATQYAADPRIRFDLFDNSGPPGTAQRLTLAELAQKRYNVSVEELCDALHAEFEAGRISEAVYRGTLGQDSAGPQRSSGFPEAGTSGVPAGVSDGVRGRTAAAIAGRGSVGLSAAQSRTREAGLGPVDPDPIGATAHHGIADADFPFSTDEFVEDVGLVIRSVQEALVDFDGIGEAPHDYVLGRERKAESGASAALHETFAVYRAEQSPEDALTGLTPEEVVRHIHRNAEHNYQVERRMEQILGPDGEVLGERQAEDLELGKKWNVRFFWPDNPDGVEGNWTVYGETEEQADCDFLRAAWERQRERYRSADDAVWEPADWIVLTDSEHAEHLSRASAAADGDAAPTL